MWFPNRQYHCPKNVDTKISGSLEKYLVVGESERWGLLGFLSFFLWDRLLRIDCMGLTVLIWQKNFFCFAQYNLALHTSLPWRYARDLSKWSPCVLSKFFSCRSWAGISTKTEKFAMSLTIIYRNLQVTIVPMVYCFRHTERTHKNL